MAESEYERFSRIPETEGEREGRASKLLEDRVRRDTIVDSRLEGHDRRLASINGQLERGAKATEVLAERILRLDRGVETLRSDLHTKGAVDDALRKRAEDTLRQQITRREFWLGVITIVIAVLAVALNAGLL